MWLKSRDKIQKIIEQLLEKARKEREKGNIQEALTVIQEAIHLDKENAISFGEYGITLAMEKYDDTKAEYNGQYAVMKSSQDAVQWANLARIYYLLESYKKALISILVAELIDHELENVQKIEMQIEEAMGPEQVNTILKIAEKTRNVFTKYKSLESITPDSLFKEVLNG